MRTQARRILAASVVLLCMRVVSEDNITATRRNAIVSAIEQVAPAVCSINVVRIERTRTLDPFFRGFWDFFDAPRAQVRPREIRSIGSGFVMDRQGHILTNYHVLQDADLISSVTLSDGRELKATYVGGDRRSDLAVLQAEGNDVPYARLGDSNDLMIGEWVIAIGNPFGPLMSDPQPTVSVGVVSANHRRVSRSLGEDRLYQDMIQTDAAINPGNSGGPLVNAAGEVVGINTMIFSESGGSIGLGFALPITRIRRVADEIIRYGRRRDPWPGFSAKSVAALRSHLLAELGVTAESGCLVVEILKRSPAYEAGLRLGDVITTVNGEPVGDPSEIDFVVWGLFVGDTLSLEVDRQGQRHVFSFKLAELSE
ncbi:MAG TPA: trypsin-like serine protease [Candidatus Hydrogenedentes bacterium]|nr:trypsin-like serine protease [Candidatus Hydrogenedentota bacterium]